MTTQAISLVLLGLILGLPAVLIVLTTHRWSYVVWMFIYLLFLPIWNFVLTMYAYWKFDNSFWGDTRKTAAEGMGEVKKGCIEYEGEYDSSKITMKRWGEFERERRLREMGNKRQWNPCQQSAWESGYQQSYGDGGYNEQGL